MISSLPDLQNLAYLQGDGPWADQVIWSRADVCRNYEGLAFPHLNHDGECDEADERLFTSAAAVPGLAGAEPLALAGLEREEILRARESGLISRDQLKGLAAGPSCLTGPDAGLVIRTQDRDHVRIVARCSGLDPRAAMRSALGVERRVERVVDFAYDDRFGYLTAEPARCGTGLALGCLVHLPALGYTGSASEALNDLTEQGLSTRGWYESDGRARGDLFVVRSRRSLGRSEKAMVEEFIRLTARLVGLETAAREILLAERRLEVEDRAHRAVAMLRHGRLMPLDEAYDHVSFARFGVSNGLVAGPDTADWNRLLVALRPGHLGTHPVRNDPETDLVARAVHLRKFFA